MDQKEFLSQEKLDTLTNRVGRLFNNLNANFNTGSTIWTVPVRMALSIETKEDSVDSVVLEARKSNGYLNNNSANPKYYHIILTRVYILVKYKHHDKEIYLKNVFPTLIADMGAYGTKDNLAKIDGKIEEIIAIDKMISKKNQSQGMTYVPTFTTPKFSKAQLDYYFHLFTRERLFREMEPFLKKLCDENDIVPDIALVWYMGRDIVLKLSQVDYPETYLNRMLDSLSHEKGVVASPIVDLYMVAAFSIMLTVTKNEHFKNAIKHIVNMANDYESSHYLIHDNIVDVAQYVKDLLHITDFDYTTEDLPDTTDEKNKDTEEPKEKLDALQTQLNDAQAQLAEKDRLLEEKEQKIISLENQLQESDNGTTPSDEEKIANLEAEIEFLKTNLPDISTDELSKFRLECVYKLLENTGVDFSTRYRVNRKGKEVKVNDGRKTHAAILAKFVTDLGESTCKNHCTGRNCNKWKLSDEAKTTLNVVNESLKELNLGFEL